MTVFMNEYEITDALARFAPWPEGDETPNLFAGAQVLARLCAWTNNNSDGWPYWQLPRRAANKLQVLLLEQASQHRTTDCTEAELRKTFTPIKAFLTRQGVDHEVVFPTTIKTTQDEREVLVSVDQLRELLADWLNAELFRISERGHSADWQPLIDDAKARHETFGIPWSNSFVPDYVREILAMNND